jgi:hypothetical protein
MELACNAVMILDPLTDTFLSAGPAWGLQAEMPLKAYVADGIS